MKRLLPVYLFLSLLTTSVLGQNKTEIYGKVTDKQGDPLVGAEILIPSVNIGTVSNHSGQYVLTVPEQFSTIRKVTLTVQYVGYKSHKTKITLEGKTIEQNFKLATDILNSEEVVVTGLASKTSLSRSEVSVSRINAAGLEKTTSFQSLSQLVEGQISGVQITSASGNTGGGFNFYVRGGGGVNGDEQPAIYVDGVRLNDNEINGAGAGGQGISMLSTLDPENIANIQVLKGPAGAAMYGTSGSNGVVLITTKTKNPSGSKKFSMNYKFTYGLNTQAHKYKLDNFISANAANAIFRNGVIRQNALSVSGGSSSLVYFGSFDDRYEEGNIPNDDMNRKVFRLNLTSYTTSNLTLKISSKYGITDISRPQNDFNNNGIIPNVLDTPIPYDLADSMVIFNKIDKNSIEDFTGGIKAIYTPVKNLEIYFNGGIDNSSYREVQTLPPFHSIRQVENGKRYIFNDATKLFTYDFNLTYSYNLLKHLDVKSIAGSQLFDRIRKQSWVSSKNFLTSLIPDVGAGQDLTDYGEYLLNSRQAGVYTEHNFAYMDKYFLTFGLREDWASSIGSQATTIIYPKASAAIRLDKFGWFPSDYFSLFKLRAAYGENGQLPDPFAAARLYWGATEGGYGPAAVIYNVGNTSLKPERIKEFETGFDAELIKDYSIEFTYYRQNVSNSIVYLNKPPSVGLVLAVPYNIGGIRNEGFETHLEASLIRNKNYGLDFSLIWNYQTNKVTSLGGAQPYFDYYGVNIIKEGLPKHEFYGYKVLGAKFNLDGTYDNANVTTNKVALGNPIPNHTGSFSIKLRFLKNFNLYALADWAFDRKMFNYTKLFAAINNNVPKYNILQAQLGLTSAYPEITRLTPHTKEYIDAANEYAKMDPSYPANYIEDASYLRIMELSLSFSLRDLLTKTEFSYFNNFTIGVSVLNVWTFTKYSGADIELNASSIRSLTYSPLTRGVDLFTLQHPRVYNFWIRIAM